MVKDGPKGDRGADIKRDGTDLHGGRGSGEDAETSRASTFAQAAKKSWRLIVLSVLLVSALLVLAFGFHPPEIIHQRIPFPQTRTTVIVKPSPFPVPTVIIKPGPTVTVRSTARPRPGPIVTVTPKPSPSPTCVRFLKRCI